MSKFYALVVDDNSTSRLVMRHILQKNAGFEVAMADSGEEALSMMEERLPDIVMLDINMPGMGGVEVLGEIRKRWATDVAVIVVTASGEKSDVGGMLSQGVSAYILKPVEPDEVLRRVEEVSAKIKVKA